MPTASSRRPVGVSIAAALACALALPVAHAVAQPARSAPAADRAHAATPAISDSAHAYLAAALDTLEQASLNRSTVDWRAVRDSAFLLAAGAERPADTYGAIDWALRRADKHGFLQASRGGVNPRLLGGRAGYLRVPFYSGPAKAPLADSLQGALRQLEAQGACGWVVDLRFNGGGNIWPMQLGIGPLLGDSVLGIGYREGRFDGRTLYLDGAAILEDASGQRTEVVRIDAPYRMQRPDAPVAVLIDGATGSSAEGIAIAFRPRPNTRFFGAPTAGYSTANRGARLADGANMVVTVGVMGDRTGRAYGGPIEPDEPVAMPERWWPTATDAVVQRATAWLAAQPACAGAR